MSHEFPALRKDLVVVRQEAAELTFVVVKDPLANRYFRFQELEGFIVQALDGTCDLEGLHARIRARFSAIVPTDTLRAFVGRLERLGLLASGSPQATQGMRPGRLRGDLFYLRLKLLDPDALLQRLLAPCRFFFTRAFVIFSIASMGVALVLTLTNWQAIQVDILRLFRYYSLFSAWLILFVVIAAHEFAHGLSCKRFGGQVHDMGVLLLYFMPGFYCDVSDAWLLPEKSKRLLITLAGGYFEVFLWSLSTLLWYATEAPSAVHDAALVVMATSGIKTLFNFNPLIKLDGYYLLSDYLEIPNLRSKALSYLKTRLSGHRESDPSSSGGPSARERKVYLMFGLLAAIFSIWLVATFMFSFGGYMVSEYKAWGAAAMGVFVLAMSRNSMRRLSLWSWLDSDSSSSWTPRKRKRLLLAAVILVPLAALWFIPMHRTVTGEFAVSPVQNADVRAPIDEVIETIYVEEGDSVQPGTLMVRLSDRDLKAELDGTLSEIDKTSAILKLAKAGPRPEEISLAATRVTKAEERLQFAGKDLERTTQLVDRALLSEKDLDASKELVAVRTRELEEARSNLKILQSGNRPEEIESLEAELQALIVQKVNYETQLGLLEVRSPAAGIVVTPKLGEKVGQHVSKGELIAKIFDVRKVEAEIIVSEKDIADVQMGQPVEIKARAYPAQTIRGTVTAIAPITSDATDLRHDRTVIVRATIDNSNAMLKAGMSGTAKIIGDKRRMLQLLTRSIYRFFKIEFWSWW